jgi:hypothetical protein
MANPDMPDYKLYIFANTLILSDSEREVIKEKLKKNGAYAIWVYASGLINPDKAPMLDCENISELIGMRIHMQNECVSPKYRATDKGVALGLEYRRIYGCFDRVRTSSTSRPVDYESYMFPAFYAEGDECLGDFVVNGEPAVSVKNADGYTSVFHSSKILSADFVRKIATAAGVHIYTDGTDVLFAGRSYITIHADSTGKKRLFFPEECTLTEVYENKCYGTGCVFEFDAYLGETKTFKITK